MKTTKTLVTEDVRAVLEAIGDGADIWGYREARLCRQLELRELVRIVPALESPPGQYQQPYFGAVPTAAGRRALLRAIRQPTGGAP